MPGLSSLQVNIKDQPHNLAWINKEEQALLKDLGGSGRPGPMGIPAYEDQDDPNNDEEEAAGYEALDGGPAQAAGGYGGYDYEDGNDSSDIKTELERIEAAQSRAAVENYLGRNYDPESLATPEVPSWGFDESGNFNELAKDIGGKPQGAFATAGEHADYFFSKKDGEVKPGVFDRGDGPPDMLAKLSPTLYAALSVINKMGRTVDPEKVQGNKSNITFREPEEPYLDDGEDPEKIKKEEIVKEKPEEEKELGTMEQFFIDKKKEGVPEVLGNIIDRLSTQNKTIKPFNEWLAGQSQAMQAADRTTQTNEYRKDLVGMTPTPEAYRPTVQPAEDRTTEQSFINNLYPSSKKTSATQALYAELGI